MPKACLIIIGNEILSGRTQDKNLAWVARELNDVGIRLAEVRVIPDSESVIIDAINHCRASFDYVFTTGGIGPTHDDITSEAVAKAFGVPYERHPGAERLLREYYGNTINEARLKMATMPRGSELIPNEISIAPGFRVENVYVMAGVPKIMQTMFANIKNQLKGGKKTLSKALSAYVREGDIADKLAEIQSRYPDVDIGSYPFVKQQRLGTSLIMRGNDVSRLHACSLEIEKMLLLFTSEILDHDITA